MLNKFLNSKLPKHTLRESGAGFTLIELLVVIAIIGVLSAVAVVSLNNAKGKARDAKRVSELKQVQVALEFYYSQYGCYPRGTTSLTGAGRSTVGTIENLCPSGTSAIVGAGNCTTGGVLSVNNHWHWSLQVLVDLGLLSELPVDPINQTVDGKDYCYNYNRVTPISSSWQCALVRRTDYPYAITFSTETANFSLPASSQSAYSYCIVGAR